MASQRHYSPTFRLSAWSVALMAAFAACAYVGSIPWEMLPQVLYMAFGASVAWVVAAYTANMSKTVKTVLLAIPVVLLVLVALIQA